MRSHPKTLKENNPNISLDIFNYGGKQLYTSNNNGVYNVNIVQMGNRYASIKPLKNKHIQ